VSDYNDRIIAEFRANGARVQGYGSHLVLLHTIGAKSGESRVAPAFSLEDGDAWLVVASAAGSPNHPAWYFNLLANPDIALETPTGLVDVRATPLEGAAYDAAWARFVERAPTFAEYKERAGDRVIPVVRLTPR
jgi:deazaflavin-dependent oxidoreductase (nitroreductase family)